MEESIEIAKSYFKQNKFQNTIDICSKILESDRNVIEALKLKGKSLLATKRIEDASLYFNKVLTIRPDDYESIKDIGNTYQAINDIDTARNYYKKAIEINNNYAPALTNLGIIELAKGKKEEALSLLLKATKSDPKLLPAWGNLATAYLKLQKTQEAEESICKAIEINPNIYSSHLLFATILMTQNKLREAEGPLQQVLILKPDCTEAYINLGTVLKGLGKLQEAESYLRKAIVLNPNLSNSHYLLASILINLNKPLDAEVSLRKSIELNPDCSESYYMLGNIYKNNEKLEESKKYLLKAIEIKPHWKTYYIYASCLFEENELALAKQNILKAIDENNKSFNNYKSLKDEKEKNILDAALKAINSAKNKENILNNQDFERTIINMPVDKELLSYLYTLNKEKLNNMKDARYGDGLCSNYKLFEDQSDIISKLEKDIKEICKKVIGVKEMIIRDSFFNIFKSGSGLNKHNHIGEYDSHFGLGSYKYVLVYYLEKGDQSSKEPGILKLYNPEQSITPINGMIVIVKANTLHSVSYDGNKDRVIVGVNFYGF